MGIQLTGTVSDLRWLSRIDILEVNSVSISTHQADLVPLRELDEPVRWDVLWNALPDLLDMTRILVKLKNRFEIMLLLILSEFPGFLLRSRLQDTG